MLPGMLLAFGRHTRRIVNMLEWVAQHHPEEPHWYLGFTAVIRRCEARGSAAN
jgi:hypothetical protein